MIDIENEIFHRVATELRTQYEGIAVYGEEVRSPSHFPCVTVIEADTFTTLTARDSSISEKYADVMYEISVYSNQSTGRKSECKRIFATIDDILTRMNFTRMMRSPVSMEDATIYRVTGRYTARVDDKQTIYRR